MNKDKLIFITGTLVSLIIIGISTFLYYKSTKLVVIDKDVTAKIVETQTPEPIIKPQETVDFKTSKIQVLNGSGVAGAAKTYVSKLTDLGYTKVTAGNYEETVTGNILMAPSDFKVDLEKIGFKDYKFEKSEEIKIVIGR